jgi:hypothetical protein
MTTRAQLTTKTEGQVYSAGAFWLAALIGLTLLPISESVVRDLSSVLITAGGTACVVWLRRYAEPGDLKPPSCARTATFTILATAVAALFTLMHAYGIGGPEFSASLPFAIGLAATVAALTPILDLWEVPTSIAAVLGGLAALAAGMLLGERTGVGLLCTFVIPGAMVGAAFAILMQDVPELSAAAAE